MKSDYWPQKIAECVGLWIAEGDDKTEREITFTNNCEPLIKLFYSVISRIFPKGKFRLYVYSPESKGNLRLRKCRTLFYTDMRANKPYYILRYANTVDVIKWKKIVSKISKERKHFPDILRGFFAGEGNIKTGTHANRTIRIAQKEPLGIIDKILQSLDIKYRFFISERSYTITGWKNWEKFYNYKIYTLHPEKKKKFIQAWKSYKEIHYPNNFIRYNILRYLSTPKTSNELALIFNRKQARLQDVLSELKIEGKIINYKCRSLDYWVKSDSNMIVISDRKDQILKILKNPLNTADIAGKNNIDWKAAKRRLIELQKLGLIKQEDYLWMRIPTRKEVIVK